MMIMKRMFILPVLILLFAAGCSGSDGPESSAGEAAATSRATSTALAPPKQSTAAPDAAISEPTGAAPVPEIAAVEALPVIAPAPAWDNEVWINSDPVTLEDLRGKVVLLEFWTFG